MHGRNAKRPFLICSEFWYPDAPDRTGLLTNFQVFCQVESLLWSQGFDSIDSRRSFSLVVLRDSSHCHQLGGFRLDKKSLKFANGSVVTTTGGLIYALLELENIPLNFLPRYSFPFIHRCRRGHNMFTLSCAYIIQVIVPPSAYLMAFP